MFLPTKPMLPPTNPTRMSRPDLHAHSTGSDGTLSPVELVRAAARAGVTTLAITDHDTFAGIDSLQGEKLPIEVLPGVELSLADMHGLHLLGYGLSPAPELRQTVRDLADKRLKRARRMTERLAELGMPIDIDALMAHCGGSVGRLHIAWAMVEAGYVATTQEAFARWIGADGPAYVAGERLTMAEALPLMRRCGFVPVLAHPAELNKDILSLRALLESWQKQGLRGVEVYHPSQRGRGFTALDATVRRMGLLVTGGSDFHTSAGDAHGALGCMADAWYRRDEDLAALKTAITRAND